MASEEHGGDAPRVLIFQQRDWALNVGHGLAVRLSAKGYRLSALTLKRSTDRFVRTQDQVKYEQIISFEDYLDKPDAMEDIDQISLDEICRDLEIQSVWTIAVAERSYVRTYGERYPYSYRQNQSDEQIVAFIKATYLLMRRLLDDFRPNIIVGTNFASTQHVILNILAEKRHIPMIGFVPSKIQGQNIWVQDYKFSSGRFFDRVHQLRNGSADSKNKEIAREYLKSFRFEFKVPIEENWVDDLPSLRGQLREIAKLILAAIRFVRFPQINVNPNVGASVDHIGPRLLLRNYLADRKNRKAAVNFNYAPSESLGRFVYMPLQYQPEAAIDVMAPYYNNQLEFTRLVAQALPDDLRLGVKDHPAMFGLRSHKYLEKLARTPNVSLLDFREPAGTIMQRAEMMVSTGGTSPIEAAFYNLPVIQFGDLGLTQLLPNVFRHSDLSTLSARIREILAMNLGGSEYESQVESYVMAAFDVGFRVDYLRAVGGTRADQTDKLVDEYAKEVDRILESRPGGVD